MKLKITLLYIIENYQNNIINGLSRKLKGKKDDLSSFNINAIAPSINSFVEITVQKTISVPRSSIKEKYFSKR
jgi:hypothetical protein